MLRPVVPERRRLALTCRRFVSSRHACRDQPNERGCPDRALLRRDPGPHRSRWMPRRSDRSGRQRRGLPILSVLRGRVRRRTARATVCLLSALLPRLSPARCRRHCARPRRAGHGSLPGLRVARFSGPCPDLRRRDAPCRASRSASLAPDRRRLLPVSEQGRPRRRGRGAAQCVRSQLHRRHLPPRQ